MRLRSLTGSALAAITVLVVFATAVVGPAAAATKKPTTEDHSTCRLDVAGGSIYYPAGTEITVDMGDGTKEVYVCRNGQWQKKTLMPRQAVRAAVTSFESQSVLEVRSTGTTGSNVRQTQHQSTSGVIENVKG
jgi:hypothetical protein